MARGLGWRSDRCSEMWVRRWRVICKRHVQFLHPDTCSFCRALLTRSLSLRNKVDTTVAQATQGLDFTAVTGVANGITLNHALTIDGKGVTSLSVATTTTLTGTGSITKSGTGTLILSTAAADNSTWSGGLTINGGVVRFQSATNLGTGNVNLAGGVLEGRSGTTSNFTTRTLGSGANQIRITGGVSGFSGQASTASVFTITGTNPLVWGSANFAPTELVLQAATANTNGAATFTNGINLNGAHAPSARIRLVGLALAAWAPSLALSPMALEQQASSSPASAISTSRPPTVTTAPPPSIRAYSPLIASLRCPATVRLA